MLDREWVEVGLEFLGSRQVMPKRPGGSRKEGRCTLKKDKTVEKTYKRFPVGVRRPQSSSCWSWSALYHKNTFFCNLEPTVFECLRNCPKTLMKVKGLDSLI